MRLFAFTIPGQLDAIVCAPDFPAALGILSAVGIHDFHFDQARTWAVEQPLPHRLMRRHQT